MGTRGPVPKREANRAGHNAKREKADKVITTLGAVAAPAPDADWHPQARDLYVSLTESGQCVYFEPSDWQAARFLAAAMTDWLNQSRKSSELFKAIMSGFDQLGVTENARRRMRIEVERDRAATPTEPADKSEVSERFAALRAVDADG